MVDLHSKWSHRIGDGVSPKAERTRTCTPFKGSKIKMLLKLEARLNHLLEFIEEHEQTIGKKVQFQGVRPDHGPNQGLNQTPRFTLYMNHKNQGSSVPIFKSNQSDPVRVDSVRFKPIFILYLIFLLKFLILKKRKKKEKIHLPLCLLPYATTITLPKFEGSDQRIDRIKMKTFVYLYLLIKSCKWPRWK